MPEQLKVGFIGLGLMGKPMARNILRNNFPLVIHNRSQDAVNELVAEGARKASSPAEVAEQVDIVLTCLPDSPDVQEVSIGKNGIIEGTRPGMVYIDHSTIKPGTARLIYEVFTQKDVHFLDAPVSGGDIGARDATLTIMVGGMAEPLAKVMPVLNAVGRFITHVGGPGSGQVAKAANQIMVAAQMVAIGELMIFAKKAGADPKKVVAAIRPGAAQCWALDVKSEKLLNGIRTPGFKAYMQAKDLAIIVETAREFKVPLPSLAVDAQLYNAMLAMGMSDLDNSAIIGVIERLAGIHLNE